MIMGVGIDYSIHIVHRLHRNGGVLDDGALETGKGVVLATAGEQFRPREASLRSSVEQHEEVHVDVEMAAFDVAAVGAADAQLQVAAASDHVIEHHFKGVLILAGPA